MPCNIYQTVRYVGLSKKNVQDIIFIALKFLKSENKEVSVHLAGDERIRKINKQYRGIDKITDVLAFAIQDPSAGLGQVRKKIDENDLGDIFISVNQVKLQAKEQSIPYKEELTRVLIHGILHLNGYDHMTERGEKKMFEIQEKLLKKIMIK